MPDLPSRRAAGHGPLTEFAAPALERAELWRLLAVLALTLLLSDLLQAMISALAHWAKGPIFGTVALINLQQGLTPSGVTWALLLAVPGIALFDAALRAVMHRGVGTLFGRPARLAGDFAAAFLPLAALGLATLPILSGAEGVAPGIAPGRLLTWLPVALPGLIAAAAASEMIYRGFLLQQLAARWQESWIWMGLPAAVFALTHVSGQAGALAPLSLAWGLAFGIAAADLTARTGSLGAAIGLQAGLQLQGIFLMGLKGPMTGLALYTLDPHGLSLLPWMLADFLMLLAGWLATRLLLRV